MIIWVFRRPGREEVSPVVVVVAVVVVVFIVVFVGNQDALSDAEKFHRATHMMLEWLTEAERQLGVANATPIAGSAPGSAPRSADEENAIEVALEAAKNFR